MNPMGRWHILTFVRGCQLSLLGENFYLMFSGNVKKLPFSISLTMSWVTFGVYEAAFTTVSSVQEVIVLTQTKEEQYPTVELKILNLPVALFQTWSWKSLAYFLLLNVAGQSKSYFRFLTSHIPKLLSSAFRHTTTKLSECLSFPLHCIIDACLNQLKTQITLLVFQVPLLLALTFYRDLRSDNQLKYYTASNVL